MIGTNVLSLCPAEVMRALEYYLNEVQFKESVKVVSVKERQTDGVFEVKIAPQEKNADA